MKRWTVLRLLIAACCLLAAGAGHTQAYPQRSLKLIVPFAVGGNVDTNSRLIARSLSAQLGQAVVVENRGGMSGVIGVDYALAQAPDGYTLVYLPATTAIARHFQGRDFNARKDITPLAGLVSTPLVMVVNPKMLNLSSVPELIAHVKSKPGLNYASIGAGSQGHLAMELIARRQGLQMIHVPYKGGSQAILDVIAGNVPMMIADTASALPHIRSGAVRPLAVMTVSRIPQLSDLPSIADQGFGAYEVSPFGGISGPPGLPEDIVNRLTAALKAVANDPTVVAGILASGNRLAYLEPAAYGARLDAEFTRWGEVIRESGIKLN